MPVFSKIKAAGGNDLSKGKPPVIILLLLFLALLLLVHKFTSLPGVMDGSTYPLETWGGVGVFIVGFLVLCLTV